IEHDACALLGVPPAPPGQQLAAEIKASTRAGSDSDPALELLRRLLVERLDCPEPALGLYGAGLLHLLTHKAEDGAHIRPDEAGDLNELVCRLDESSRNPADAARAGAFLSFMLDAYGV